MTVHLGDEHLPTRRLPPPTVRRAGPHSAKELIAASYWLAATKASNAVRRDDHNALSEAVSHLSTLLVTVPDWDALQTSLNSTAACLAARRRCRNL